MMCFGWPHYDYFGTRAMYPKDDQAKILCEMILFNVGGNVGMHRYIKSLEEGGKIRMLEIKILRIIQKPFF